MRRNIDVRGFALGQRQPAAEQAAGNRNFILDRRADDGGEQKNRMNTQTDCDIERAIIFFRFGGEARDGWIRQMNT